jgi:RNA 2',3'-cyclic 3'-phosphodiesterase
MSVIRAFIAIDLPTNISQRLDDVSMELREKLENVPVRWVQVGNIHLTLKFLGDVSIANLEILKQVLESEVVNHKPFSVSIGNLGAYPNLKHPRVMWVGVEAPNDLAYLQRSIETAMARLGYAKEDRPFTPHLTLGRVSRNTTSKETHVIGEVLDGYKIGFLGVAPIKTVHLYKSDLHPTGSIYTKLHACHLKAKKIV